MSSSYGINTWDGIGTPTGGLVLHATVTCIYIASIPLSPIAQSMEAKQLVQTLYTYGHSIVGRKSPHLAANCIQYSCR